MLSGVAARRRSSRFRAFRKAILRRPDEVSCVASSRLRRLLPFPMEPPGAAAPGFGDTGTVREARSELVPQSELHHPVADPLPVFTLQTPRGAGYQTYCF